MVHSRDQADEPQNHSASSYGWRLAIMLLLALGALTAVVLVISHPMMEHEVSHFDMDLEYQTVPRMAFV